MKKIPCFVGILLILHTSLSADEKSLGSILKNSGESKKFIKASANKKTKSSHFIFDKNGDS
ncbi:MAG: hypothetical protein IE885_06755 [Campylobacterales bacterium]|nr:hypothetical protein [Campylobacterales bacterium]